MCMVSRHSIEGRKGRTLRPVPALDEEEEMVGITRTTETLLLILAGVVACIAAVIWIFEFSDNRTNVHWFCVCAVLALSIGSYAVSRMVNNPLPSDKRIMSYFFLAVLLIDGAWLFMLSGAKMSYYGSQTFSIILFVLSNWICSTIIAAARLQYLLGTRRGRITSGIQTHIGGTGEFVFRRGKLFETWIEIAILIGIVTFWGLVLLPFLLLLYLTRRASETMTMEMTLRRNALHFLKGNVGASVGSVSRFIGVPAERVLNRAELKKIQKNTEWQLQLVKAEEDDDVTAEQKKHVDLADWHKDPADMRLDDDTVVSIDVYHPETDGEVNESELRAIREVQRSELFRSLPGLDFAKRTGIHVVAHYISLALLCIALIIVIILALFFENRGGSMASYGDGSLVVTLFMAVSLLASAFVHGLWRFDYRYNHSTNRVLMYLEMAFVFALASPMMFLMIPLDLALLAFVLVIALAIVVDAGISLSQSARRFVVETSRGSGGMFEHAVAAAGPMRLLLYPIFVLGASGSMAILHWTIEYVFERKGLTEVIWTLVIGLYSMVLVCLFALIIFEMRGRWALEDLLLREAALQWAASDIVEHHSIHSFAFDVSLTTDDARRYFNHLVVKDYI